jgi:GIY-YIG catalytic domain
LFLIPSETGPPARVLCAVGVGKRGIAIVPKLLQFYVYILASLSGTLYVGLTDNLKKRIEEHRLGLVDSFTKKYKVNRLMYYEIS